jgi:hypothetical protein
LDSASSFVDFGLVTQLYILPRLRILKRDDALIPLVVPPHVSVHWTQLPSAWGCLYIATISLRCSRRIRRFGYSHTRSRGHHSAFQACVLRHLASVAVQRVGRDRPPICVLPRTVRGPVKSRCARSRVLHSNGGSATSTYHAWPDILASRSA